MSQERCATIYINKLHECLQPYNQSLADDNYLSCLAHYYSQAALAVYLDRQLAFAPDKIYQESLLTLSTHARTNPTLAALLARYGFACHTDETLHLTRNEIMLKNLFLFFDEFYLHPSFNAAVEHLLSQFAKYPKKSLVTALLAMAGNHRRLGKLYPMQALVSYRLVNPAMLPVSREAAENMNQLIQRHRTSLKPAVIHLQRFFRSTNRRRVHRLCLKKTPRRSLVREIPGCMQGFSNRYHFLMLIDQLSQRYAVTGTTVDHYTSFANLQSILAMKAICGNTYLHQAGIAFDANCLGSADVSNGDGNAICCAPLLVDTVALKQRGRLKENLIKLSLDVTALEKNQHAMGKNDRQFFKLNDSFAPEFYLALRLTDCLEVVVSKYSEGHPVIATLYFNNTFLVEHQFSFEESLFYGNLVQINYFCMLQFFKILDNPVLFDERRDVFLSYLDSLSEQALAKVLVGFAQSITPFAEFNFWTYLPIKRGFITRVTHLPTAKSLEIPTNDTSHLHALQSARCAESYFNRHGTDSTPLTIKTSAATAQAKVLHLHGLAIVFSRCDMPRLSELSAEEALEQYFKQTNDFDISQSDWDPRESEPLNIFRDNHQINPISQVDHSRTCVTL